MYYVGKTFSKKENVQYKTEKGARAAAEKKNLNIYDAGGNLIYTATPQNAQKQQEDTKTDKLTGGAEKQQESTKNERTDTSEEREELEGLTAIPLGGTVKRICSAKLRIRSKPSWSPDVVTEVSDFDTKEITHLVYADGKPMYRTAEGTYISAHPDLVEYMGQ